MSRLSQDGREGSVTSLPARRVRFSRNARSPSCPSRRGAAAGRCARDARGPLAPRPVRPSRCASSRTRALAARAGRSARPRVRSSPSSASTRASSAAPSATTSWTRPIRSARSASKRSPVANSARACDSPIFGSTKVLITAGRMPSLVSVNPKVGLGAGDDDVGDGAQAHPAAERRAVDAGDDRHRAGVDGGEHRLHRGRVALVVLDATARSAARIHSTSAPAQKTGPVAGQDDAAQRVRRLAGEAVERRRAARR